MTAEETSSAPLASASWVTREITTLKHLRGVVEALESENALDLCEVRLFVLRADDSTAVQIPTSDGPMPVFYDSLPTRGILMTHPSTD